MSDISLYLASQSPRRRELLTQIGISFDVLSTDIDESIKTNEIPQNYVVRLAREKARAGWKVEKSLIKPILGSDTSVVINGEILGKPESDAEAIKMLNLLSGNTHQVMTAVALAIPSQKSQEFELRSVLSVSDVSFKELSNEEIERYVATGECADKAGSYGIQGQAGAFITHLSGSYSGVMGLPLYETAELLNKAGIRADFLVVSET
jgi:nucleoside triphosphate pyrophosphatase